jgi:ribosomal-protein-alanine N-acetyltransferase
MKDEPFEPLETTRLLLRCVAEEDAGPTAELMTPEASRWIASWPVPFTHMMAIERIKAAREQAYAGMMLPFAIIEKATAELIGWITLNRDHANFRCGSLGYWLGENHHGKGYMRELATMVLEAGFKLLDLDIIEAGAQPENVASFAIMRACGMQAAGDGMVYAPARGREEFCVFYEIKRPIYAGDDSARLV